MPEKDVTPVAPMRILKTNCCPSLSGRSELTYHIGCNAEGEVQFRVVGNSGSGQFNSDAVSFSQIRKLLSDCPADKPMTSTVLRPAFRGKSSNSPAFLFAALKAELIVLPGSNKDSGYTMGDIEVFRHEMNVLIASTTSIANTSVDEPAKKKPVGRKPSGRPIE
ncbi:MAG: hypothetical protein H6R14_1678 [Proteobacteria bacterium]|nr:hypothetical protein [Pseudomonadota bacterium]